MKTLLPYIITIITALMLMPKSNYAQNIDYPTILKFAQYVYWSETQNNDTFYIYIATENYNTEQENTPNNFNNRPIAIQQYNDKTDISNANIIYVDKSAQITNEIFEEKIKKMPILTLTNNKNLLNYGCMFFIEQKDNYVDYLFQKQAVIDSHLTIRTSLLHITHQYK